MYTTRIAKSTNQGASWQIISPGTQQITFNSLAVDPTNSNVVYAGGYWYNDIANNYSYELLKSGDGGMNWTEKVEGMIGNGRINILVIDPVAPYIIYAGANNALYKSLNGADSWTNMGRIGVTSLLVDPVSTNVIYAGAYDGVSRSLNGGSNWSQMNEGLTVTNTTALALDPVQTNRIYAATYGGGIFTYVTSEAVKEKKDSGPLPKTFTLYQNYPNPFNASTQIRYAIPEASDIQLNIYNIKGELIRALDYGLKNPGFYVAEWNGRDNDQSILGTGVYFCHFVVNGITMTQKMLLMK